jgi:hypothetical protein
MRIREAQKHMDPTDSDPDADPDPQHCQNVMDPQH